MSAPGKCPHCGVIFARCGELTPWHDEGSTRSVTALGSCQGSGQIPRHPTSDRRPLWREEEPTCCICGAVAPSRQDPYGNDLCFRCGEAGMHGQPQSIEQVIPPEMLA